MKVVVHRLVFGGVCVESGVSARWSRSIPHDNRSIKGPRGDRRRDHDICFRRFRDGGPGEIERRLLSPFRAGPDPKVRGFRKHQSPHHNQR